jgi:AcrR family transcriptional regulator
LPKVSETHRINRRRQILDAAIECFARKGFQRTSMEDIIRESNLSAGAIYSYFLSKDQIIETLADERHEREKQLIEKALTAGEWSECLSTLVKDFYESLRDPSERKERRLGIHLWAEALSNPRVLRLIRRGINQPLELLSDAIRGAQTEGRLRRDIDPDSAARVLVALFHGFLLQQAWDDRADIKSFARAAQSMAESYFSHSAARRATVRQLHPR